MSNFINFNFDIFSKVIINTSNNDYLIRIQFTEENKTFSEVGNNWVKQFSTETKINWIVYKIYLNKHRYTYKNDYICRHVPKHKIKLYKIMT